MSSHRGRLSHQPTISFVQTAEECKLPSRPPRLTEKMSEMKESWWRTSKNTGQIRFKAWEYFKDFSGNTSIHGIKYLGEENRHVFEKVCWIVFLLLSVGFCSHLIFKVWVKWNSSPVIVSFNEKSTPVWEIPFPAVTICSETKARQTLFNFTEAIMDYHLGKFTHSELQKLGDVSLLCDKQYMKGDLLTNESVVDFYREVSPTPEQMLMYARWRNVDMNVTVDFFTPTVTEEGICYTFNMLDPQEMFTEETVQFQYEWMRHGRSASNWSLEKGYSPSSPVETYPYRALGAGYTAGLTTLLRSFSMDIDYLCKGAVPGFRILLHNPAELPRVSQQFLRADLNQELVVSVKPVMITTNQELRSYSPHRRQCFFPFERRLRFFKVYTQNNCQQECLTNFTLDYCGCVGFHMPRSADMPLCGSGSRICYSEAGDRLLVLQVEKELHNEAKNSSAMNCDCLPACTGLQYDGETSSAHFDWESLLPAYNLSVNDPAYLGANIGRVIVFFKETQFITSRRSELYGISDFMANCGGLLGLFMGISMLSLLEIFYYLTIRLCCDKNMRYWLEPSLRRRGTSLRHCHNNKMATESQLKSN